MSHPCLSCHANDSLTVAAQRMWDHDCGALAVVNDDGKLVGMITDRDICMAAYTRGQALEGLLVNGAMSKGVVSADAEDTIREVSDLMARHHVRRVPITNGAGEPIGVISLDDLALESVQPDTRLKNGLVQIAHTLAAICQPHPRKSHAI